MLSAISSVNAATGANATPVQKSTVNNDGVRRSAVGTVAGMGVQPTQRVPGNGTVVDNPVGTGRTPETAGSGAGRANRRTVRDPGSGSRTVRSALVGQPWA
ncbi:hypothetical protein GCM10012279_56290 [Micromonospora yangpuensis]|nr:hypothetical protein GCM10012279_56290 [Micromonospora yangpuensis]